MVDRFYGYKSRFCTKQLPENQSAFFFPCHDISSAASQKIMRRNLELFQLAFSTDLSEIMNGDITKIFVLHL